MFFLGGVVGTLGAPLGGVHHRLEERTEDGGRDGRPVEAAGVDQSRPHRRVKIGNGKPCREQVAIDIGKAGEVFIEFGLTLVHRRIQHLEQPRERGA